MANTPQDERRIDADYYDSTYFDSAHQHLDFDSPLQRYRVTEVVEIFASGADQRVLDLGCGWGILEWALAPRVGEMLASAGFEIEMASAEGHLPGLRQAERLLQRFVPPLRRRIAVLARKP